MRRWELCITRHDDGSLEESLFADDDISGLFYRRRAEEDGAELVWTVEAENTNDAMRKTYRDLGRGDYQPMSR